MYINKICYVYTEPKYKFGANLVKIYSVGGSDARTENSQNPVLFTKFLYCL